MITQTLAPTIDGDGRIAICEIMVATPAIRNLIREGKVHQIPTFLQSSSEAGMISFDQHLAARYSQRQGEQGDRAGARPRSGRVPAAREADAMTATMFSYEALDSAGGDAEGHVQAETAEAAAGSLGAQKLIPLTIEPAGKGLSRELTLPSFRGRTTLKDLAVMSRQFASMTTAGLTLLRSLSILEEQTEKPKLRAAIESVAADVQNGQTLSGAMAKHDEHFPLLMINMIRAGETGGFLDDALARIARMYEADASLRAKLKSAMTYPVIVLVFSLLLGAGVLIFIVPVFEGMFRDLGGKLPLPTRVMVTLSHSMWFSARSS